MRDVGDQYGVGCGRVVEIGLDVRIITAVSARGIDDGLLAVELGAGGVLDDFALADAEFQPVLWSCGSGRPQAPGEIVNLERMQAAGGVGGARDLADKALGFADEVREFGEAGAGGALVFPGI